MSKNSFLHAVGIIHFDQYKPDDVAEALHAGETQARKRVEKILEIPDNNRTYDNTVAALSDSAEELDAVFDIVSHLANTMGGQWQEKESLATEKISAYYAERGLDERIYHAVKYIQTNQDALRLTPAKKRLVEDIVIGFEHGGVNLPKDKKGRIKALHEELSSLTTTFGQNVVKATDAAHLIISTRAALDGIDDDHLEAWAQAAKEKGVEGYYIQMSQPNFDKIMTLCTVKETRLAMHRVARSRAPKNEAIARKILTLRRELVTILGFKNYADYVTERRMAKTGTRAYNFIKDLTKNYTPHMLSEAEDLQAYARKQTNDPTYTLDYTDVDAGVPLYFASKQRAEKMQIDEQKLREYFPLDTVLQGLFDTLHTLYGLRIEKANVPTYHKDVQPYFVYNEAGQHLSTVWCDWFARKGKQAGAWEHTAYIADRANGKIDKPHLAFVCANFPAPTKTKPSLLDLRDVETMWHEFGHFIHATCGMTELRDQNGYHCMWDFIEAPSQIMENWVWTPEVLGKIARHYKTGAALPTDIINKLQSLRSFRAASNAMYTLCWSTVDMALHVEHDPTSKKSIIELSREIKSAFFPVPLAPYDTSICTFTHIFSGGYAGAYYGYKWAESIEADLFSRFKKEGVLNPQTGRAYRDTILARGDEVDPGVLIRDFLGRDSTTAAMLERDGLAPTVS